MNTVRNSNLTARQRRHYVDVVSAAVGSLKQVEVAERLGLSQATVCRVLKTGEAIEAIQSARAKAVAESWGSFQELLELSIATLKHILTNPMVHQSVKARVAVDMLKIGLDAGPIGDEGGEPLPIVFGGQPLGAVIDSRVDSHPHPVEHTGRSMTAATEMDFHTLGNGGLNEARDQETSQ